LPDAVTLGGIYIRGITCFVAVGGRLAAENARLAIALVRDICIENSSWWKERKALSEKNLH